MIINATTGQVYASVADAARASGVNRGSISAAVRGKRPSAGGYQWRDVGTGVADADLSAIVQAARRSARQFERGLTEAQKERRRSSRAASKERAKQARKEQRAAERIKSAPKQKRPRVSAETRAARSEARQAIRDINAARAKLLHMGGSPAAIKQIEELIKRIAGEGTKKGGYIPESAQWVASMSDQALGEITGEIKKALGDILARRDRNAQILMLSFSGLSLEQAQEWEPALNAFLQAIGQARELSERAGGNGKYREIYSAVTGAAYRGTLQDLLDITQQIMEQVRSEQAIAADWVSQTVAAWRERTGYENVGDLTPIAPNW